MAERTPLRRPARDLIHLLNRRYHREWVRAELLQNELIALRNSRAWRLVSWLPRLKQRLFPPPPEPAITERAVPYTGPSGEAVPVRRVSIIIPFRDQPELLRNCLRRLSASTFRRYEVVLVDNGSTDPRTRLLLAKLRDRRRVRVVDAAGPFNFSRLCNAGADAATGDGLLFLNNDTEVLTPDWLEHLLALAADPHVGVVGATLLYPDGTVQHAGLFPRPDGAWVHPHRGRPADAAELNAVRAVPAVTGACLFVRREVFEDVGGFDESFPVTFNDVDFCARVRAGGRLVLVTPGARLIHYEGLSRGYSGS
jgi:GT2 family glycosyltransferase